MKQKLFDFTTICYKLESYQLPAELSPFNCMHNIYLILENGLGKDIDENHTSR